MELAEVRRHSEEIQSWKPVANPMGIAAHLFNDPSMMQRFASVGVSLLTEEGQDLFKHWVIEQWLKAAQDPERNREMRLANQMAAVVDVMGVAQRIPGVSVVVPSPETFYLPARILAMAAWSLKLRKLDAAVQAKEKQFNEEHRPISFSDHLQIAWDRADHARARTDPDNPALATTGGRLPPKSPVKIQVAHHFRQFMFHLFKPGGRPEALLQGASKYVGCKLESLWAEVDLTSEESDWKHHMVLLGLTSGVIGDTECAKWARWHALFTMAENYDILEREAPELIGRTIEYWQSQNAQHEMLGVGTITGLTAHFLGQKVLEFKECRDQMPLPKRFQLERGEEQQLKADVERSMQLSPDVMVAARTPERVRKAYESPWFTVGMSLLSVWAYRRLAPRLLSVAASAA